MSPRLYLDQVRNCLEGIVPAGVSTCGADGMPNVTYVSQLLYVDPDHVALSYQFFNKTRENILYNPRASVLMMDPDSAARYRLELRYLRTETEGPLFERMKAKLAGIASHEGMEGVFRLRGTDIYRVIDIEHLPGRELPVDPPARTLLPAVRRCSDAIGACEDLESLCDCLLDGVTAQFDIDHAMLLFADATSATLYVVASRGYPQAGTGAEIPFGVGVMGVAAQQRVPIRIMFAATEYAYTRAVRERMLEDGELITIEQRIPLPGLDNPASQMAIPLVASRRLYAVLYLESQQECRFGYDIEDALVVLCAQAAERMALMHLYEERAGARPATTERGANLSGEALRVEYYARDHSLFVDGEYLIKGVAGAIFWVLLNEHRDRGRTDFSNRELRRDARIGLPEVGDNLEARLILLTRRLDERALPIRLEKPARGRIRLTVGRPLELILRKGS